MGIFDAFKRYKENSFKKGAERAGDVLKNKVTNKDQRLEAIDQLREGPSEIVVPQLLKRYEIVVDHSLQDQKEKEIVFDLILTHKEEAIPWVLLFISKERRIAWPLRLAEKLLERDRYISLLVEHLVTATAGFDDAIIERNTEILLALKEAKDPLCFDKVCLLARNRDESVRMAALECLESLADKDKKAVQFLLSLMQEPRTDDNSRYLTQVQQILKRHNWA